MSEKRESDTLKQQREARKQFLELKKMQNGEMESGPKPSEVAIVPKTPKEKLQNIWFHDKWYIIGFLALAIAVSVMVAQCANRKNYDLKVVIYTQNAIANNTETMEEYFSSLCDDINGDGQSLVQVINCSYSENSNNTQQMYTVSTKLQSIIATDADALLFIVDENSYKYFNNISEDFFADEPIPLNQDFYKKCDTDKIFKLPENLLIGCRKVTNTTISKNKMSKEYFKASQKILEKIKQSN
ncbi:MAG: hypothetical protein MJ076_06255 [Clostridia bacterium]|nr:hypothetical protein [Clostridia bacterium]